jgi:hypothetical protein
LFRFLRHNRLPGFMAEQEFLLVPRLAGDYRAHLLIAAVTLTGNFADAELGSQDLRARERAFPKMLRLGALAGQGAGLEQGPRNRISSHS